ncbi:DNA (cytosine-5-)-methyltransferase [Lacicoccus alkaliphilus]|uniref:Cytosine-specific methyltransferase n=1 Tax=Lacicoccus alkaliphilus DSM 16010 TaxID=1123231 RepID=A0A1M7KK08_9BACL|nr:DNA (cytosine-5-)-methyltransferase [Salinicoccus alkaliphilus]SHM65681.1 DNA (cytosine-5)-methyltransferase 1 [Salinicoccus alkaliphilus DSM 16010]
MTSVASLFAGIGGIELGFKQAGAEIIWANEFDKYAAVTYRENFDHPLIVEDITKLSEFEMPNADIITAGWPCVAFSVAGNRHGMKYKCLSCTTTHFVEYEDYILGPTCPSCGASTEPIDPRGTLFYDVIRFIREKQPRAIFLENVKNLRGHDKGHTFKVIEEMLKASGYYFKSKIMNTMDYGNIPQNRERIYIVGFKSQEEIDEFEFPEPIPLTRTIHDLLDTKEKQDDKYYYKDNSQYYNMLKEAVKRTDTVYQLRRVYVRENQSNVCPTLTANMGTGGHNVPIIKDPWGIRKMTPWETLKFQGYPEEPSFIIPKNMANSHIYKQVGNSVSVPVVRRIAEKVLGVINSKKKATIK